MSFEILLKFQPEFKLKDDEAETLSEFINSGRSVELEIGCGNGKFLINRARAYESRFFVAIDRVEKWMKVSQKRARLEKLNNILFIKADARLIFKKYIPAASLDVVHINFPDPWPKKKHLKRRIVNRDLLKQIFEKLKEKGCLYLATDDEPYFRFMRTEIQALNYPWRYEESINQKLLTDIEKETRYEAKWKSAGKNLHYIRMAKK